MKIPEVEYPKANKEYWVVVDEDRCILHFFTKEKYAKAYAEKYGHEIIYQECMN